MSKVVKYKRDKKTYDNSGVTEKLADTRTPWWVHMNDLFHNFHQGQNWLVDAYVRFTQIDDKFIRLEVWEENGTGVGMSLKKYDAKYLRTLTVEEFENLSEEEKEKDDLGVHTMGVTHLVSKMHNRQPEAMEEGVVTAFKTKDDKDWTYVNRHASTLKDIVPPTHMSEDELEKQGVPVTRMGNTGLYLRVPKCDTTEWGDDWFDKIVKLTEFYFKFALEKQTIKFTFEYVNLKGKSDLLNNKHSFTGKCQYVVEAKPLIQPCVHDAPYFDQWKDGTVEIGGKTFPVKALERPQKEVLNNGHDFESVRKNYSDRYFKHPMASSSNDGLDYRDNFRIIYEDEKTGVILGIEIINPSGKIRHRGDIRVLINKKAVKTDTAKSMITFYQRNGKTPYKRGRQYEPHTKIKESFDSLFPKIKVDENNWRVILKDILTGKRWPVGFTKASYKGLCEDIGLKPFDYKSVNKSLTSIKVLDSEVDLYFENISKIMELKIKNPDKDKDYNQLLAYLALLAESKYEVKEFIMMAHSQNSDEFDDDSYEKFETRLNVHFKDKYTFKLLNLKDYGLDSTCIHDGYKNAPKR